MELEDKRALLAYLKEHNDKSNVANELISLMTRECNYVDCNSHSVSIEDLDGLGSYHQEKLRKHFGKADGEKWTMDECEKVAEKLGDLICEDYGEDLHKTIELFF